MRRGDDVLSWRGKKYGTDILDAMGYHSELTHLSYVQQEEVLRLRKLYGNDDPRSVEAFRQYTLIRNQIARARTQGTWADDEFQDYIAAPTKSTYESFIRSAEKTQAVSPLAAAPPKHPELEEERGTLFGTLLLLESVSGTTLYNLRKKLGFGSIDWIEQTESDERLKEISPMQALGYTTRETRIWTPRGVTGLLGDIVLDPLTYISPVASIGGKALKVSRYGKNIKIGEEGTKILERQTRGIREAYPNVSAREAREAAESLVYGLAQRKKSLLAARKYQEPSFSVFNIPIFYYSDLKKPLRKVWDIVPYHKQGQAAYTGVASEVRKTFEPFYEVGQAAGTYGKDIFGKAIRTMDYERDVWGVRARELYRKGPRWWRRKETADVNEQALEWIQRGVEPTDPRAYAMAEDLVTGQREAAESEIAAGLLDPATLREGYVFRVYSPKFQKEVLEKEFGHRKGDDIMAYVRQLESRHPRIFMPESSHKEINEWAMKEYGMKALITDPAAIMQMRGIESSRAIGTAKLHRMVGEELGVHPEKLFPLSERRYHKYTPAEIDEILEERYGTRLLKQYKRQIVVPTMEAGAVDDATRYLVGNVPSRFNVFSDVDSILTSLDAQIASSEATRLAGVRPWHITARGKGAESKITELVEKRNRLEELRVTSPLEFDPKFVLHRTPEEVAEYLAAGRGFDVLGKVTPVTIETGLTGMPKDVGLPLEWTRYVHEQKAIQKQIDITDAALSRQREILAKETVLPTLTMAGRKAGETVWELQETKTQVSEFYTDYYKMSPHQRALTASRLSKLTGITKDDKQILQSIELQSVYDVATGSPISWLPEMEQKAAAQQNIADIFKKVEHDQATLQSQILTSPLPEDVMVGPKGEKQKLILRPYQLTTGEKKYSYVDERIVKELDRTVEQSQIGIDVLERYMRWGYTVPWVSFHTRNVQGIAWQNMYYKVSPKDYGLNWEILHGDPDKVIDVPTYGKMTAGELRLMYEEAGIYGQTGYIQEAQRLRGLPMGPMPEIENLGRGALATRLLMSGKGIDEAALVVRQVHFEYGMAGLTSREQKVARRLFLFYTWPKKNVELTTRMLGQQPSTMATAIKGQQYWVTPEEYDQLPPWAKELYVLTHDGQFYVMDVPFVQGIMTAAGEGYAFSHTPLMKFYVGAVWGIDPATGRKLGLGDMPMWAAEAGVGRFVSFDKELQKAGRGDITWEQMAMHQVGGMYVGELDDIPLKDAYRAAMWVEWKASEEEKLYAFEASGRTAAHYETLWKPPGKLRGKEREKAFMLGRWGFKTGEEEELPSGIVIGYTHKQWEIIAGHKLSDEQKAEVKTVYEQVGAREAALLRVQMAAEYHTARVALGGKEPVPPEMITEAYNKLVYRVGPEAAKKWHYKAYYSEKNNLLGVLGFTGDAWEGLQGFELSEAQKQWLFRETLAPAEGLYNEWIEEVNQIEGFLSISAQLFPRPTIPKHQLSEKQQVAMVKQWKAEADAKRLQEEEWRKEYAELRADPIGKSTSRVGIPATLMLLRGREDIGDRAGRMDELETLMGTGVDR